MKSSHGQMLYCIECDYTSDGRVNLIPFLVAKRHVFRSDDIGKTRAKFKTGKIDSQRHIDPIYTHRARYAHCTAMSAIRTVTDKGRYECIASSVCNINLGTI